MQQRKEGEKKIRRKWENREKGERRGENKKKGKREGKRVRGNTKEQLWKRGPIEEKERRRQSRQALWMGNLIRGKRKRYAPEKSKHERMKDTENKRKRVSLQLPGKSNGGAWKRKRQYASVSERGKWQRGEEEKDVGRHIVMREGG
jgi:hypothetical protein